METKVIQIEIQFAPKTLALLAGLALLVGALVALLWTAGIAAADPGGENPAEPQDVTGIAAIVGAEIHYQGRLEGVSGTVTMTLRLWDDPTSTAAVHELWMETKTVTPTSNGLFNTQLGDTNPLVQGDFDGQGLWLGVEVAGDGEMVPRQEILPVPYAMSLRPGATIRGADSSEMLLIENTGAGPALRLTGGAYGLTAYSSSGTAVEGISAGDYGVYGSSPDAALYGMGDVKQNLAGDGLVKAAIFAACSGPGSARHRFFNNVTTDAITISDGLSDGTCVINFHFDLSNRYWVAMATSGDPRIVNCVLGAGGIRLDCSRYSDTGLGQDGGIMVLVY